jgi:hypothetical protein
MKCASILRHSMILALLGCSSAIARAQIVTQSVHCASTEAGNGPCLVQQATGDASPGAGVGIVSMVGPIGLQEHTEVVTGLPYTAQATTEIKQTLGNGSHITQKSEASVGRDSKGRTFRTQTLSAIGPWAFVSGGPISGGHHESAPTFTTIFDPVSKTHIDFTDNPKQAHVIPLPDLDGPATFSVSTAGGAAAMSFAGGTTGGAIFGTQKRMDTPPPSQMKEPEAEQLGEKTIEGLKATGKRTHVTIPANAIGNDSPIEITHETWYSPELKLVLESTQNDPRFGQTKYALTKISVKEPNEKLFQIPPGYAVEDVPAPPPPMAR